MLTWQLVRLTYMEVFWLDNTNMQKGEIAFSTFCIIWGIYSQTQIPILTHSALYQYAY